MHSVGRIWIEKANLTCGNETVVWDGNGKSYSTKAYRWTLNTYSVTLELEKVPYFDKANEHFGYFERVNNSLRPSDF